MKLRIRGNSIRFRLTQSEVEKLGTHGKVEETIEFGILPNEKLIYTVVSSDRSENVGTKYENGEISVIIPKMVADEWITTEKIGIAGEQVLDEGKTLSILVEKDFACLTERAGEDESDNFPNPGKVC